MGPTSPAGAEELAEHFWVDAALVLPGPASQLEDAANDR